MKIQIGNFELAVNDNGEVSIQQSLHKVTIGNSPAEAVKLLREIIDALVGKELDIPDDDIPS